jgi:hypothetical protein
MSSTVVHIAAVIAALLIGISSYYFPGPGLKGLAIGLSVAISLAVVAAFLITAARSFGP